MDSTKDITFYINIPYCNSKCHFCVYVAHIKTHELIKQQALYADYVEALKKQIRHHAPAFQQNGYRIHSVYFGGGTPTALSSDQLIDILTTLFENIDKSPNYIDTTLETTPENVIGQDFNKLRNAGFDRISMGVQSMLDKRLKRLGRCHTNAHVISALEKFKAAGFDNVNIDLMVGLPDETSDEILQNLEHGAALGTNHCTVYMYIPAENTVFKKTLKRYYREDELYQKYNQTKEIMERHGFYEYQWQYFSKDKSRCICDTTYFGLTTEWFAFGSTGNSLYKQAIIKGPAHHKDFIENPLSPGLVVPAKSSVDYLDLHYELAITSEVGLDVELWKLRLGISLTDTIKLSPTINATHNYLLSKGWLKESGGRFYFPEADDKTKYCCMKLALRYDQQAFEDFKAKYYALN